MLTLYSECGCKRPRTVRSAPRDHKVVIRGQQSGDYDRRTAAGAPSRAAWQRAYQSMQLSCYYCATSFRDENPPTIDHVKPRAFGGQHCHGVVLACSACNNARGMSSFAAYEAAAEKAREIAERTGRPYCRPKLPQTL